VSGRTAFQRGRLSAYSRDDRPWSGPNLRASFGDVIKAQL
jgi:hypothetical protein